MKNPILNRAVYLILITLGMAAWLTGISWLLLLGSAVIISVYLYTGSFSGGSKFMTAVGCVFVLSALVSSIWFFKLALRDGHLWQRSPPSWWWVAFVLTAWVLTIVKEVRKITKS
jgi:4-hydroxybenzoate polyprenyltransferase